jgi:hypothetical protein
MVGALSRSVNSNLERELRGRNLVSAAGQEHHRLVMERAPSLETLDRDDLGEELGQLLSPLLGLLGFGLGALLAWIDGRRSRG